MVEQNGTDPESMANKPPVPPREDLVNTAAKFLSSPNVQKSPNDMKIAFLKKKGLSDTEIDLALKKCESILQTKVLEPLEYHPVYKQLQPPAPWAPHQRWITIRDLINTVMLLAGIAYGIFWIYKKYIWSYLFGKRDKKPSSDEKLNDIEAGLLSLKTGVDSLKEAVDNRGTLTKDISELKSEVASLKKLLLSRKQFPSTGTAPLSIPSWQIAGAAASDEKEEEGAATNGSDSSLEMIKE